MVLHFIRKKILLWQMGEGDYSIKIYCRSSPYNGVNKPKRGPPHTFRTESLNYLAALIELPGRDLNFKSFSQLFTFSIEQVALSSLWQMNLDYKNNMVRYFSKLNNMKLWKRRGSTAMPFGDSLKGCGWANGNTRSSPPQVPNICLDNILWKCVLNAI